MTWFQENGTIGEPPENCDICSRPLKNWAVNGKVRVGGGWCWMCLQCHRNFGVGTGVGKGQIYQKEK